MQQLKCYALTCAGTFALVAALTLAGHSRAESQGQGQGQRPPSEVTVVNAPGAPVPVKPVSSAVPFTRRTSLIFGANDIIVTDPGVVSPDKLLVIKHVSIQGSVPPDEGWLVALLTVADDPNSPEERVFELQRTRFGGLDKLLGNHPVHVYHAPGETLAVFATRDGGGSGAGFTVVLSGYLVDP